ncbi:MAG: S8/S53 family peptidase [Bacteroidota bacterium]|jgi:hypothetical protein
MKNFNIKNLKQWAFLLLTLFTFTYANAQMDSTYYEIQTNENGDPIYFKHQIIIAFNPELLNKIIINDSNFVNGVLANFLSDSAITLINSFGLWNETLANSITHKIYRSLDTDDTLSLTRSGETISIPKYWATLLVYWPLIDETPVIEICDSLNMLHPIIEFAHPNFLYKLNTPSVPNDPYYSTDQFNLHINSNSPINGNIEIENAWSIETGSPEIKMGIFDAPIIYTHVDFGGGTLATSKIKGGRLYYDGLSLTKPTDIAAFNINTTYSNHGTNVAGIAAAIRNNEKGIAGVAGGDFANGNVGTSLYTFGIFGDNSQTNSPSALASDARISEAITDGANYILQPNGSYKGYGLDIQNHSWGQIVLSDNVKRAIKGAARNQCINVCSRGNDDNTVNTFGTTTLNFPATYNDEWVLSVGASGNNKVRLNITAGNVGVVNGTSYPSGGNPLPWSSMYGKGMDVLAPGAQSLLITTNSNIPTSFEYFCQDVTDKYCYFNGTSAAAPHVSGLAALILSKYRPINGFNERLEPEDVEHLIEQYADHKAPAPNYYNDDQGWGLINPDNTLDKIKDNKYKIYHFTNGWPRTETYKGNVTITIPTGGAFNYNQGTVLNNVEKWEIVENYTHTYNSTEQILGYWERLNSTVGLKDFSSNTVSEDDYADFKFTKNGNILDVKVTTYAYKVTPNKWLNLNSIADAKTAFSVHTFDPTKSAIQENTKTKTLLTLYPNPTNNKVVVNSSNNEIIDIAVLDLNGKLQKINYINKNGTYEIDTQFLESGVYFCKATLKNNQVAISKLIIIK